MQNLWFMDFQDRPVILASWAVWVVVSIVLHELAHGWVAIRCGDDVPIGTGHMTWNPLVHIPPMAWIMFVLFGFTWGLMPTNPNNYNGKHDEAKVAFAGPAMNLLLAAGCFLADAAWVLYAGAVPDPFRHNFHTFLWLGCAVNLMGFLFNLIPCPPLDGSRILENFVPAFGRLWRHESAHLWLLVGMIVLFRFVGPPLWKFVFRSAYLGVASAVQGMGGTMLDPL